MQTIFKLNKILLGKLGTGVYIQKYLYVYIYTYMYDTDIYNTHTELTEKYLE